MVFKNKLNCFRQTFCLIFLLFLSGYTVNAQEDLLSLLEEEPTVNYTSAAFKTNRVINLHSIEHTAKGVLDFKISHRFGFLNGGFYELFGLDNASIRLGLDYGITDRIQIGWGRSSFEKTYDGYAKLKLLRQSTGARKMPISASIFGSMAVQTLRWPNPDRENLFTSRLYYTTQVIIGSKINDNLSLQVSPTLVHRNLVATTAVSNDVYAIGFAGRVKITSRLAINAEYIFVLPDQISPDYRNSISLGIDLETGGHVFQLHFTNSTSMIEKGFITETVGNWADGGVHFGFNVSRVFTVVKPKFD